MISEKVKIEDRITTLSNYVSRFDRSDVEDVTCENFMTSLEGTHSVLLHGVVYDWDTDRQQFLPRK